MSDRIPRFIIDTIIGLGAVVIFGFLANLLIDAVWPGDPFGDFLPLIIGIIASVIILGILYSQFPNIVSKS